MLLRSTSTPILNSWLHHYKDSTPPPSQSESPEPVLHLPRTRSLSLTCSVHCPSPADDPARRTTSILSKPEHPPKPKKRKNLKIKAKKCKKEEEEEEGSEINSKSPSSNLQRLFSISGLGKIAMKDDGCGLETLVVGGGVGSNGGRICSGSGGKGSDGGGGGDGGGFGFSDGNNHGSESRDAYYQKMIEANPGNGLLLGNYAKFLKEVRGDYCKAEEYCGRAILANPNDGDILSLYADIIWRMNRDVKRAESYFDQAVKASPDDCYVLASYAHFLWDAEDEEEENEEKQHEVDRSRSSPSTYDHGSSLTTA